jgi:hypothetical protein
MPVNAAPALEKDTTGLGLAGATEGAVDHEGRGNGAPGVGCVAAKRPNQGRLGLWETGQQKSSGWRTREERGGEKGVCCTLIC